MSLVRLIARPMLASVFIAQGVKSFRDPDPLVPTAKSAVDRFGPVVERHAPDVPTDPRQLIRITAAAQVGAGLALATGKFPRLAALVLAGTLVPSTVAHHPFWDETDPQRRVEQRTNALKNAGLAGGLLLASVDTEGKPGLGWRAKHAAERARKVGKSGTRKVKKAAKETAPA